MRRRLWWAALGGLLLHQIAQKGLGWACRLADAYLDPLLCMPLLLGLAEWEWGRLFDKSQLQPLEIVLLTTGAIFLFEWGFPAWSAAFTADLRDIPAYITGSIVFSIANKTKNTGNLNGGNRRSCT
ncbi:MAG: hypothetical protein RIC19_09510 [Phaeodactylibacter sp.]|uniref:hypothetical protein n=1 Tax=Phaeodactylibacter sp. TaxID=1940289 RepID=UPI0032EBAC9B